MAGKSFGGTVKLTGESEYQKALKGISSNLKVLNSEMKLVASSYDKNDKSTHDLASKSEVLNKKLEEQKNKVNTLKEALEKSKQETGENSETTKKWQVRLNEAQADVNKTANEIKNLGKETDDAGQKTSRLGDIIKGNLISDAIVAGVKAVGSAMKQVGSAVLSIGKQAIQSYAEYEQLVGGVETLFKGSANTVQEYANNAYKTAGLSANKYMETVTSFSASLLQSLGGDTEKAAKSADQAIIDMSDNANKMGTSMEMIQNAYQGFAKQNYTMLDNLKLGYGGTKGEMERLLADAEKLSGKKYDIKNLNDVYEAIHVVQTELGITGTTAKEASETISGSINALKGSWENLLVGIADDNADFDSLVNNFVDSVLTAGDNILPRIETSLDGIVNLVVALSETLLPKVLQMGVNLIKNLITGISQSFPQIVSSITQVISTLLSTIVSLLPQLLQMGITLIVELARGIGEQLPTLIPLMIQAVLDMVTTLIDNIDLIIEAGVQLIVGLAVGLIRALPVLVEKIPTIIDKLVTALTKPEMMAMIIQAGILLVVELGKALIKAIPQLVASVPKIISSLKNGLEKGVSSMISVGKDLVRGIWSGISNSYSWIKSKISGWVGNVTSFIKKLFGIHSPSTLFRDEIGTNLALGIGEGFSDTMGDVSKEMAGAIPTEFEADVNYNSSANESNYDVMVEAFKTALKDVKVVMNNREMGAFVTDTMERVVYS